jgi:YHYH protein
MAAEYADPPSEGIELHVNERLRLMGRKMLILSVLVLGAAACGGSSGDMAGTNSNDSSPSSTSIAGSSTGITNTWVGPATDTTKLPIGTSKVSLSAPAVGGLFACDAGNPRGGGAAVAGPWIDEAAGTWNLSKKIAVQGNVSWPMASYNESTDGTTRTIISNGLPVGAVTGTFPIAANDPAYAYDRNPNRIAANDVTVKLPVSPTAAATPTCLGKGRIGVLKNGVSLFASLDERNRDAVAYETQDSCDGHPQQSSVYHYHDIPSCVRDAAKGASTVVGWAYDGYPIVVERDAAGNLPTNADLDVCHGRTSPVEIDGKVVTTYHYSATYEFPYFMGCFKGRPIS